VTELRTELEARLLSPKGLKSQLIARLTKTTQDRAGQSRGGEEVALRVPHSSLMSSNRMKPMSGVWVEEEKRKQDERERVAREKRYTLPDAPHILVHPSRVAKSGKFDCTIISLSLLLDYRPEDTKVNN
ncbi:unnamed protein product, partial [Timema podura]|nr:unnamed protein product [Timema podura]